MSKKKRSSAKRSSATKKSVASKKKSTKSGKAGSGMQIAAKLKSLQLGKLFSLDNEKKAKKSFSTSFECGNIDIDLKGNLNKGEVELEFDIKGKKFGLSGKLILDEKVFSDFQKMLDHVFDILQKITSR